MNANLVPRVLRLFGREGHKLLEISSKVAPKNAKSCSVFEKVASKLLELESGNDDAKARQQRAHKVKDAVAL